MSSNRQTTPPNQTSNSANDNTGTARRQSTCIRTPLERPGFIQTQSDSRRSLQAQPPSPSNLLPDSQSSPPKNKTNKRKRKSKSKIKSKSKKNKSAKKKKKKNQSSDSDSSSSGDESSASKEVDLEQDSNEEKNKSLPKNRNVKGGFDNPKLFFFEGFQAPDEV
jgi:hypothetical protein